MTQRFVTGFMMILVCASSCLYCEGAVSFEPLGVGYGQATTFQIALADLDGDGDLDAVFANQGSFPSRVLRNDGDGNYTDTNQELTGNGHGVGIGDLDGDGAPDLFIACAYAYGISRPSVIYFNDGHGAFTDSGQDLGDRLLSANLVQLADVDNDGDLDAFVAYLTVPERELISHVYLNDGDGVFSLAAYDFPFGTLFGDLDNDGDLDAFVKETGSGYRVLANDGAGGFEEVWRLDDPEANYQPWNVAFGDFDGDGDVDVFDANGSGTANGPSRLLLNDGVGGYALADIGLPDARAAWPVVADFDGDGNLDVFLSLTSEDNQLWLGDGAGGFTDSGLRLGGADSRGAAAGDVDGDGDLDLFVPVYGMRGGPNVVWQNLLVE